MKKINLNKAKWLVLCLSVFFVTAVILGSVPIRANEQSPKDSVLRIGGCFSGFEDFYKEELVEEFEKQYPNTKVELVSLLDVKKSINDSKSIDMVIVNDRDFGDMIKQNLLKSQDSLIKKSNMDMSLYAPCVIDTIKAVGKGAIYGLAPTFKSEALCYSKKVFEKENIDVPKDGMTWHEVLALSERIAKNKNQICGLSFLGNSVFGFWDMLKYIKPLELKWMDDENKKLVVNTPQWEKIWTTCKKMVENKSIYYSPIVPPTVAEHEQWKLKKSQSNNTRNHKIAAMYFTDYGQFELLKKSDKQADWAAVTPPIHSKKLNVGGEIELALNESGIHGIMCINHNSSNPELAFKLIQFMMSEKMQKRHVEGGYLPTMMKCAPDNGCHVAGFYKQPGTIKMDRDVSSNHRTGYAAFENMLQGKKTPKQALEQWEKEGTQALKKKKTTH